MFSFSRLERFFLLALLACGLSLSIISYQNKINPAAEFKYADLDQIASRLMDINTATLAEIESLPGIGPVLAGDIARYREEKGGFNNIEELKILKGIGDKKFNGIKGRITTGE